MPRELRGTGSPAGVFGLLNERSLHYEDNFVPLPSPPATATFTPPTVTSPTGRLKRSASQPTISRTEAQTSYSSETQPTAVDDIRLAHGAVTSSTFSSLLPPTSEYNSLAIRYDTAPQYRTNKILASFHDEFQHFGERHSLAVSGSLSAPSTPRASRTEEQFAPAVPIAPAMPDAALPSEAKTIVKRQGPLSAVLASYTTRKLSHVSEEQSECGDGDAKGKELVERSKAALDKFGAGDKADMFTANPSDESSGGLSACPQKVPLTKQVFDWLHGPNTKVTVNRSEMNAFSPTSF